jgi:hypothetical protein
MSGADGNDGERNADGDPERKKTLHGRDSTQKTAGAKCRNFDSAGSDERRSPLVAQLGATFRTQPCAIQARRVFCMKQSCLFAAPAAERVVTKRVVAGCAVGAGPGS